MEITLTWKPLLKKYGPDRLTDAPLVRQLAGEASIEVSQYIKRGDYDAFVLAAGAHGITVAVVG